MGKHGESGLFAVEVISVLIFELCFSVREAHFCCEMYQLIRNNFLNNVLTKNVFKKFNICLKNVFYFDQLCCLFVCLSVHEHRSLIVAACRHCPTLLMSGGNK